MEAKRNATEDEVEALIQAYRPLIVATARRLCPQAPEDEDLLQCGMIGVWQAAEKWDRARPFGPLARCCIRREMAHYLRYRTDKVQPIYLEELPHTLADPETSDAHLRERIARQFRPDSPEGRLLTALCDGEGLQRVARGLGLSRRRAGAMARRAALENLL